MLQSMTPGEARVDSSEIERRIPVRAAVADSVTLAKIVVDEANG
jgi:hypothetical protein